MSIIDHNYYLNPHIYKWISQLAISDCCMFMFMELRPTYTRMHGEIKVFTYIYNMCESLVRMNVALEPTTRVIVLSDTKQFYKL